MPDYARLNQERWALFPRVFATGLAAGAIGVAFRFSLEAAEAVHLRHLQWARDAGWVGLLAVAPPTVAAVVVAVFAVRWFAPEAAGSGLPHIKGLLQYGGPFRDVRVIAVKFVSGVLGIGAGLGLGREGPTIQMGAAAGRWVGRRWTNNPPDVQDSLLICGGAAGLAAAFNAPVAAVIFALEELQVRFSHTVFFSAAVACLVADVVTRFTLGELPVFHLPADFRPPTVDGLPHCVLIGVLGGLLGIAFNRSLLAVTAISRRLRDRWVLVNCVLGGALVAALGWMEPTAVGGGLKLVDELFDRKIALGAAVWFLVVRVALTTGSYGLGSAGGIFAPLLLVGGLLGTAVGQAGHQFGVPGTPDAVVCTAAGMAALFGGMVRCPLTGIVLLVAMTGSYPLILPLMCAAFVAAGVADVFHDEPIYTALMNLGRGKNEPGGSNAEPLGE